MGGTQITPFNVGARCLDLWTIAYVSAHLPSKNFPADPFYTKNGGGYTRAARVYPGMETLVVGLLRQERVRSLVKCEPSGVHGERTLDVGNPLEELHMAVHE